MALTVEFAVNGTAAPAGRYLTWAPAPARLRVVDADGVAGPIAVRLRTRPGSPGKLVFRTSPSAAPVDELALDLATDGTWATFFMSGRFGSPSRTDGDAVLQVRPATSRQIIASVPMMVRIRKDAESLTTAERRRFLSALARLNNQGAGIFRDFRAAHTDDSSGEAHGLDGFMPWHRAYLLDLERELQRIDPAVTLPYWRFDRPSPKLFGASFIGAEQSSGIVRFAPTNPLQLWVTDGQLGISRLASFDPTTSGANVSAEAVTVGANVGYAPLRSVVEGNPHGSAHVSFRGLVSAIDSAARDPLFFLLHCNVDRLWAKWQWFQGRFDISQANTYRFRGSATSPGATQIGHNALDTMWPWNGVTGGMRPPTAPRQPFPESPVTTAPGPTPTVGSMIDFQGIFDHTRQLGFDYDDVPYEA